MELLHPVCAGLYPSAGETRRPAADRHAGSIRSGALLGAAADEVHPGGAADDALCHGERAPAALRRVTARVGGHVGGLPYQLLHVDHVPDDLRSWTGRVGAAGQAGRLAAGDVDRWRSHTDACDGMDISARRRPCLWLRRAAGGVCCRRHFQLVSRTTESLARIVCVRRSEDQKRWKDLGGKEEGMKAKSGFSLLAVAV